jgi:hypothetical protein
LVGDSKVGCFDAAIFLLYTSIFCIYLGYIVACTHPLCLLPPFQIWWLVGSSVHLGVYILHTPWPVWSLYSSIIPIALVVHEPRCWVKNDNGLGLEKARAHRLPNEVDNQIYILILHHLPTNYPSAIRIR